MKIAINLLNYNKNIAGNGYYAKRLLNKLQEYDKINDYHLYFNNIAGIEDVFEIKEDNFKVIKIDVGKKRYGRILYEQIILPKKLNKNNYDIIFSPSINIPLLAKADKIINTIHDLTPFVIKKYSLLRRIYYKSMCKLTSKKVDKIITVSENSKKDIIKYLNISSEKVEVVYNFLEKDYANVMDLDVKYKDYFLMVSTIQPGKNLINLFRAFKLFLKDTRKYDIKLLIAGKKGWGYKEIFDEVEKLELKKNIIFLGYVTEEELKNYYKKAKALIYPSFYEGFGIPPLEAMTLGTPVVVSKVASLPEIVGDAGVYVDPYNIKSICNGMKEIINPKIYLNKKKTINKQIKKFNGDNEIKKLLDLWNN